MEKWVFHIMTVCNPSAPQVLTEAEQLIKDLNISENNNPDLTKILSGELLTFSKKPLEKPLTTLPEKLQNEALEIFKSIQLYSNALVNQTALDYHVILAQNIAAKCLREAEFQNEMILQLIKQTTNHPYPNSGLTAQTWQLFAVLLGVFKPTKLVHLYLFLQLKRSLSSKKASDSPVVKYVNYCLKLLEDSSSIKRIFPPSRLEIVSVFSIMDLVEINEKVINMDFTLLNGDVISVPFSPITVVDNLLEDIRSTIDLELKYTNIKEYAIFFFDPRNAQLEMFVKPRSWLMY